jgi:uncharacterized protein
MTQAATVQDANKVLVRASFDRWAQGTGSPFELLLPDAQWTIVGSSPLSKTYHGVQSFLDEVIRPFNARMRMRDAKVTTAIAFFDTREFDEFWHRVKPQ